MLNPIGVVFPLVWTQPSIKDGTVCENVSQLEAFNCWTSYFASIELHLSWLFGFYSKCASESCSSWHYEDTRMWVIVNFNLIQGFWLYLKIPFSVKLKIKVGQMNWWTKLTNNIVIRSLYNVPNKQILLSQWKLPCSVAATLFSSRDLVFPEVRRNVVRKSVVGLLQVNV